ncbi:hypothetical protein PMI02_04907 [Novosphingobium sp. AP12]|nr:hypothetical protein PMI02_04907 [Novosphingobium sp. AP12]
MLIPLASDADVLHQIETFCSTNSMGVSTFGRSALGDPNLVTNLRAGRSLTLKTAKAVLDFIASYPSQSAAA